MLNSFSRMMTGSPGTSSTRNSRTPTPTLGSLTGAETKPLYEAESPDELALVDAAYAYKCRLLKRTPQCVKVTLPGRLIKYLFCQPFLWDCQYSFFGRFTYLSRPCINAKYVFLFFLQVKELLITKFFTFYRLIPIARECLSS